MMHADTYNEPTARAHAYTTTCNKILLLFDEGNINELGASNP